MSAPGTRLFDSGLQPERTALAWMRTALALAVGALVASRLLAPELGRFAVPTAALALLLGLTLLLAAHARYRRLRRALLAEGQCVHAPDGRLLALAASLPVLGGATATALLVVG